MKFCRPLLALLALCSAVSASADTVAPVCEIVHKTVTLQRSAHFPRGLPRFTFYLNATDDVALKPVAYNADYSRLLAGPIEYRVRLTNVGNLSTDAGFDAWKPWVSYIESPLYLDLNCTRIEVQIRAVDAAGNRSAIQRVAYPVIAYTPQPRVPAFAAPVTSNLGTANPTKIAADADLDGDGSLDAVLADDATSGTGTLTIRRNTGGHGGAFTNATRTYSTNSLEFAVGNFSGIQQGGANDGRPDLAVAVGGGVTIEVNQGLTNNELGFTPQLARLLDSDFYLHYVAAGDLNGDGFADLAVTAEPYNGGASKVAIFLNRGTANGGGFGAPAYVDLRELGRVIKLADLNNDGRPDLIVGQVDSLLDVFMNDGNGGFTAASGQNSLAYGGTPLSIATGDLTGDGLPDLAIALSSSEVYNGLLTDFVDAQIFRNKNDGTFEPVFVSIISSAASTGNVSGVQAGIALADVNGDGRLDMIAGSDLTSSIGVTYLRPLVSPTTGFLYLINERTHQVAAGAHVRGLAAADLDGNGFADLVTVNESTAKQTGVLLNVTPGGLVLPQRFGVVPVGGAVSGYDWMFSAVLGSQIDGLTLVVESKLASAGDDAWAPLPGGGQLVRSGVNLWKLTATDIPTGQRVFRLVAKAGSARKVSAVSPVINVLPPSYSVDYGAAELYLKNRRPTLTAFSSSRTLKVLRGQTGVFGLRILNTGSVDSFRFQAPRHLNNGAVRIQYSLTSDFTTLLTPNPTTGTLTTPVLRKGASYLVYMRARAGGNTVDGETISVNLNVIAEHNYLASDTITLGVKPASPGNIFFVTNTTDTGAGSLRKALEDALSHPPTRTRAAPAVRFEVPSTDPNYDTGFARIKVHSELPAILWPGTVVDGSTQDAFEKFTGGTSGGVVIAGKSFEELQASYEQTKQISNAASSVPVGLTVVGGGCTFKNLNITNFDTGMLFDGATASRNVVAGCGFIANRWNGLHIRNGSSNNVIGQASEATRNFFVGQDLFFVTFGDYGVLIEGDGSDGNKIQGNHFGFGSTSWRGCAKAGVKISDGASGNYVGGTSAGKRNVIAHTLSQGFAGVTGAGVLITGLGTNSNFVQGNYIGTNPEGNSRRPNANGVIIEGKAANNLIGGTDAGAGNVISGNDDDGVHIDDADTQGNRIVGNIIGLDANGDTAIPNAAGVAIYGGSGTVIGGPTAAHRNIISGNSLMGIQLWEGDRVVVQNNYIGTDRTGTLARGNQGPGIQILSDDNLIGGDATTMYLASINRAVVPANLIAYNTEAGVDVFTGKRNTIRGNNIHSNGELGINHYAQGESAPYITANDFKDADTGANDLQNYPIITSTKVVTIAGRQYTQITGSFNSRPSTVSGTTEKSAYLIDVYSVGTADPSGFGEGRKWLGYVEKFTDVNGDASYTVTVPGNLNGQKVCATVTREKVIGFTFTPESTSEFSLAVQVFP